MNERYVHVHQSLLVMSFYSTLFSLKWFGDSNASFKVKCVAMVTNKNGFSMFSPYQCKFVASMRIEGESVWEPLYHNSTILLKRWSSIKSNIIHIITHEIELESISDKVLIGFRWLPKPLTWLPQIPNHPRRIAVLVGKDTWTDKRTSAPPDAIYNPTFVHNTWPDKAWAALKRTRRERGGVGHGKQAL